MDQAARVGERHRLADPLEHPDPARQVLRRRRPGREQFRQGLAVDQLHHEERPPVRQLAQVVDRHDRRVLQPADVTGLLLEAGPEPAVREHRLPQHLQGHPARQQRVEAAPHLAHAAPGQERLEAVARRVRRRLRGVAGRGGDGRGQAVRHPGEAAQQPQALAGARAQLGWQLVQGRRRLVGGPRLLPPDQPFGRVDRLPAWESSRRLRTRGRLVAVRQSGEPGSSKGEPPRACCTRRRAFIQRNFTVGTATPSKAAASACVNP